jgi:prolyl oligopeptidase
MVMKTILMITGIMILGFLVFLLSSCGRTAVPETSIKAAVDTLHGAEIVDNYRWLENGDDPEVNEWENQQDQYCRRVLEGYPKRRELAGRVDTLMKIGFVDCPDISGGRYFYIKRLGDADHAAVYFKRAIDAEPEVVIDPNTFSADGTVALDWWYPSPDGRLIAFGKSARGTENSTLFIMNVDTEEMLGDTIPQTRAASIAWLRDNSGFYYTRYPAPGSVPDGDEAYYRRVYFHRIGEDYSRDALIFGEGRDKTEWPGAQLSPDNRYLMVPVYRSWSESELFLKDLKNDGPFIQLTGDAKAIFAAQMLNDAFFITTNYEAPRCRVMKGQYTKPKIDFWKEIIPEENAALENMAVIGNNIVVTRLDNAASKASIYTSDGKYQKDIRLPAIGSILNYYDHVLGGEFDGHELTFGYNSYFIPPRIYLYDLETDEMRILDQIKTDLNLAQFEVEQVRYPSKDGTEISMFLTHKKGLELNGDNPTLVYGYGGFAGNETPYFSRTMTMFLQRGGIFAHTQLRGGAEYGEEWHKAGMLDKKQNVFDDFIAAIEWLIENKYTNPNKIVIEGGSNGGLLVGAVMVQRPDLMNGVVCSRPLLDMLRYHRFLMAEYWILEYGSAEDPEQFKYLYAYSPYHNIKSGTAYPAVLFESADHDTRVDPLHARKMAAALQAATSSDAPILLRVQRKTGHGMGMPRRLIVEELTDSWSFIFWRTGL